MSMAFTPTAAAASARLPHYAQSTLSQRMKAANAPQQLPRPSTIARKRNLADDVAAKHHPHKTRIVAVPSPYARYQPSDIIHDAGSCMFRINLDTSGRIAALCYLPTRLHSLVDFYHTEIPESYRHLGLGDLLAQRAFQWAEENSKLVIPTCAFVQRYLKYHHLHCKHSDRVVRSEQDAVEQLALARLQSQPPSPLSSPASSSRVPSSSAKQ